METATLVAILISGLRATFSTTKRSIRGTRGLVEVMSLPALGGSLLQLR